jgi:hypothetical protein
LMCTPLRDSVYAATPLINRTFDHGQIVVSIIIICQTIVKH